MNILHYSLGLPPYRSGGMTKFCVDLIEYQKNENKVFILWPGMFKNHSNVNFKITDKTGFKSIEMINPLPVPICNGLKSNINYFKHCDIDLFVNLYTSCKIDLIHIHTLQGLYLEALVAAKKLGIRTIYTTHDYFGICPTTHLFYDGKKCDCNFSDCSMCNSNAYSLKRISIMQSRFYRFIKKLSIINGLKKRIRGNNEEINGGCDENPKFYIDTQKKYLEYFNYIDRIHCNSSISYSVFSKYVDKNKLFVQNIVHLDVKDYRKNRTRITEDCLNFLFLGSEVSSKGFFKLIDILDEVYKFHKNFILNVYSRDDFVKRDYIKKYGTYKYNEQRKIFNNNDLLFLVSQWNETFGFTIIEAYYNALPSFISSNVGAKDIIENGKTGFVVDDNQMFDTIMNLFDNPNVLNIVSNNIRDRKLKYTFKDMVEIIYL